MRHGAIESIGDGEPEQLIIVWLAGALAGAPLFVSPDWVTHDEQDHCH